MRYDYSMKYKMASPLHLVDLLCFLLSSGAVPLPRQQRLADAVRGLLKSKREADEKVRKVTVHMTLDTIYCIFT